MLEKTLKERIEKLGSQLGLPEEVCKNALPCNWEKVFEEAGAHSWDERYRVHDSENPELKSLPMVAPGGEVVLVSQGDDWEYYVLVQVRNNGEAREEDKEIGFPGGACAMWGYTPEGSSKENIVLEHPLITAYREWKEEVGIELYYELSVLTIVTTTNHYNKFPDSYAMSMYYKGLAPWEYMKLAVKQKGSSEGKIKVIPIRDVPKYKWFPDASEAFEYLLDNYHVKW